jgi:hypothetical protein
MKKILLLLTAIIFLNSYNTKIFAQENTTQDIEITTITQEENTEEDKEEEITLSEKLDTQEEETDKTLSFTTILFATLTPILFLVICYMLIKLFKE